MGGAASIPLSRGARRIKQINVGAKRNNTACTFIEDVSWVPQNIHLNLVFDINKTIILEDATGGKNEEHILNEILAEYTWGEVGGSGEWHPLQSPGPVPFSPKSATQPLTYGDFVLSMHPDPPADAKGHRDRIALRKAKATRDHLKGSFTSSGMPGHPFRSEIQRMKNALQASPRAKLERDGPPPPRLLQSFLCCLASLRLGGVPFSLQFRTFGGDLPRLVPELDQFCSGEHPLCREIAASVAGTQNTGGSVDGVLRRLRMDGSHGSPDYRLHLDGSGFHGTFLRGQLTRQSDDQSCAGQKIALVLGTLDIDEARHRLKNSSVGSHSQPGKNVPQEILHSLEDIHSFLQQGSREPPREGSRMTLGLRDHWEPWRKSGEHPEWGKLCPLDIPPSRDPRLHFHTVFFDDNVKKDSAHIIDARDVTTGKPIAFSTVMGVNLIRAEPYEALLGSSNFFLGKIKKSVEFCGKLV
mmetsp:Transcript_5876/g.8888  ORF Transcript_5876/g.8888 Transcript_5876/m.8888 type:complete len:469 (-) Transcript_5876:262-1668(-)|eukprot:CAMPEP_0113941096 /NCGR_PEP_ID=MMETSP1339-20121228/7092_1 /TAXON_ID=94617 /ORGANISM="Fibrocapsa japonica" /LENGTH=468 /DNA_ID=CAMNT_0000945149 /DNA_START=83 /DNA_END=1489 /DNA_ORIENTATION=- /assembly_acc=CAM_ASM_000762